MLYFILYLFILSFIAGLLLSKISFVGKAGIWLAYHEYSFFKSWYKSGLLIFIILLLLFYLHYLAQHKLPSRQAAVIYVASIIIALLGLYIIYYDFNTTLSHRLLGKYFHTGMYLFWLAWISISVWYLSTLRKKKINTEQDAIHRGGIML